MILICHTIVVNNYSLEIEWIYIRLNILRYIFPIVKMNTLSPLFCLRF